MGKIRLAADEELTGSGVKFFARNGLIYRRWIPQEREEETEQLVVPFRYRKELLKLAHTTPFVGHLGKTKTTQRLLQRFYWPGIFRVLQTIAGIVLFVRRQDPRGQYEQHSYHCQSLLCHSKG